MNEREFVQSREPGWKRLHSLVTRASATPSTLKSEEMLELVRLYRSTSADLARLQVESGNQPMLHFLNGLVASAYGIVYRQPRKNVIQGAADWLASVARGVRELRVFMFAAIAIALLGAIFASTMLTFKPDLREHLISPGEEALFEHWKKGEFEDREATDQLSMASFYARNNPLVAIAQSTLSAASFGVFAVKNLFALGTQLGSLSWEMASVGKLGFFYSSIMPHGATELSGAILSSGVGLFIGWSMFKPGQRTRTKALKDAVKTCGPVFLMSVLMMFIAAPFEAFFSFNPAFPQWLKAVTGLVIFGAWICFWTFVGRPEDGRGVGPAG